MTEANNAIISIISFARAIHFASLHKSDYGLMHIMIKHVNEQTP